MSPTMDPCIFLDFSKIYNSLDTEMILTNFRGRMDHDTRRSVEQIMIEQNVKSTTNSTSQAVYFTRVADKS